MVKYYNRLAAVLVKFEELLLISWKSQIDAVKVGLKASLLRLNEDKKVEVNVEKRSLYKRILFLVNKGKPRLETIGLTTC